MNGWIDFFCYLLCGAALLLSVLGLWFTAIMPGIDRWSRHFFLVFFTVLMLICFSGILETVLLLLPVPVPAVVFLLALESLFLALPLPMSRQKTACVLELPLERHAGMTAAEAARESVSRRLQSFLENQVRQDMEKASVT